MSRRTSPVGVLAALACTLTLASCGGGREAGSTDPLEVTIGEEFTWNDFTVEEGWELTVVERQMGIDNPVDSPRITGSILNEAEEERAPLFQVVLSQDGDELATLNCSAMKLAQDQSGAFECPGLGAVMPPEYDTVTVMPIERETGETGSDSSGT